MVQLFPDLPNADKIQEIWTRFDKIYEQLQPTNHLDPDQLQDDVNNWITIFTSIYLTKHVTPYMHILVSHIPQFIPLYGSLACFSQQGLEKLNDEITKDYFRSTNQCNTESLVQLMCKLNRLEELSHDYCRIKNMYASYVNQQDTIVVHVQISLRNDNNCDIISMYTYICIFNKIFLHQTIVIKGHGLRA